MLMIISAARIRIIKAAELAKTQSRYLLRSGPVSNCTNSKTRIAVPEHFGDGGAGEACRQAKRSLHAADGCSLPDPGELSHSLDDEAFGIGMCGPQFALERLKDFWAGR